MNKEKIKKQKDKAELRKRMIEGYKRNMNNKKLQEELKIWDEVSGDGISMNKAQN